MDNFDLKQYLAENKLMQKSSSKINMGDVYLILKTYKFNPRIIDGNKITGIKAIDFGTYDEKTGEDAGMLRIDSKGAIYGQDNWGMDIENADEILDAIDQYRKDQYSLENPLNEDLDLPTEVDQYLKDNPFTRDNQFSGEFEFEIKKRIQDKLGRPLTPKEKGAVTRIYKKSLEKYWGDRFEKESNEEQEAARNRYQKNLLPLIVNNGYGTPDPTYYELAYTYYSTDRDGKTWVSHSDSKSGYTDYKLKDKWIDTPVEDSVLNKFWKDNTMRYFGIKRK